MDSYSAQCPCGQGTSQDNCEDLAISVGKPIDSLDNLIYANKYIFYIKAKVSLLNTAQFAQLCNTATTHNYGRVANNVDLDAFYLDI